MDIDAKRLSEMAGFRMVDPLTLEQAVKLAVGGVPLFARPTPANYEPLRLAAERAIECGELAVADQGTTAKQAHYYGTSEVEPSLSQSAFREWLEKILIPELRDDAFFFLAPPDQWPAATSAANKAATLDERERGSLLRIIRALDVMTKLPERGAATSIQAQLQTLGFGKPNEATIRNAIRDARALEPDSKPQ